MDLRDRGTQKMALAGTLGLGLIYGFFFTSVLPFTYKARGVQAAQSQAHLSLLSSDVTKARAAVANLPALEAEYVQVKERWESMSSLLPSSKEIASLLTKVTVAGQESGVDFGLFKPGPAHEQDFYVTYPAQYRVEGGYHEVGRFMAEVANMDRIVNVVDLSLTAAPVDENSPERTVVAAFTAEAYAFKDSSAASARAAQAVKVGAAVVGKGAESRGAKPAAHGASGKVEGKAP